MDSSGLQQIIVDELSSTNGTRGKTIRGDRDVFLPHHVPVTASELQTRANPASAGTTP